jgi:hypothetical protein
MITQCGAIRWASLASKRETWSPAGRFEAEFAAAAQSFTGPDWAAVTLNAYRARWRDDEAFSARYAGLQQRLEAVEMPAALTLIYPNVPSKLQKVVRPFATRSTQSVGEPFSGKDRVPNGLPPQLLRSPLGR